MMRRPVLRLYMLRGDEPVDQVPSQASLGRSVYLKYMVTMTLLFCLLVFVIQSFTFFNFWRLTLRVVFSTVLTMALMLGVDCLYVRRREKRL